MDIELAEKIYEALVNKNFRMGPRPDGRKKAIIDQIMKTGPDSPVCILLGWGCFKNHNLAIQEADLAESATLDRLFLINEAVKKVYPLGLKFNIILSNERAERVNQIPRSRTDSYLNSLSILAKNKGFINLFSIRDLYDKFRKDIEEEIVRTNNRITDKIKTEKEFPVLLEHAKNNLFYIDGIPNKKQIEKAAIDYVVFKVAEDEAQIYRDFADCTKAAFCYPAMGHGKYLTKKSVPPIESCLSFYTSDKGVKAQPWQGIGKKDSSGRILIVTKKNLS